MKYDVIKIGFLDSNRLYFFDLNNLNLKKGDSVIVSTDKGEQFGTVMSNKIEIDEKKIIGTLKKVLRIASKEDIKKNNKNEEDAKKALIKAREIAKSLDLNMKIIGASFTFDRNQLMFNFTADDRIDFRDLAKRLAAIYKTRIELRQIGVRDKAKEVGGIGPCGRFLCCSLFLNDFESVSINMAKNQYISLKPDKINGVCGRLLCCLNYEDKQYTEMKVGFPKVSSKITVGDKEGKVISCDLFNKSFTIETSDKILYVIGLDEYESNK